METATGQAFPRNMGKIIGTLDVDVNLVLVEDQPTETPVRDKQDLSRLGDFELIPVCLYRSPDAIPGDSF